MTTPNIEELRLLAQTLEFSDAVRCSIQRAADLLQSQVERIKVIERESEMRRIALHDVMLESDQLRAQLAAIAATEPVDVVLTFNYGQLVKVHIADHTLYEVDLSPKPYFQVCWAHGWAGIYSSEDEAAEDCLSLCGHGRSIREIKPGDDGYRNPNAINFIEQRFPVSQPLTHPMPAQRLTELKLLMLTTAYEQGVGKGIQRRDCNPYAADTEEHAAWKLGYEEGLDKPMPAQDVEDAERYRWLREQHWSTDTIAVVLNPKQAVKLGYVCPSDSLLDETIDAAIAKGAK